MGERLERANVDMEESREIVAGMIGSTRFQEIQTLINSIESYVTNVIAFIAI
jgi:hypothetical protein